MELATELEAIAVRAAEFAAEGEAVEGVLAAEPYEREAVPLRLRDAGEEGGHGSSSTRGRARGRSRHVRSTVSIAALCEVAEDSAAAATSRSCGRS